MARWADVVPEGASATVSPYRNRNGHGIVVQCASCRCVRRRDGSTWDWVSAWAERSPVRTSHTICPSCVGFYWGEWAVQDEQVGRTRCA